MDNILKWYNGKKVLITGHTGFKGSWLSEILLYAGAEVTGYALDPPTDPALFELLGLKERMRAVIADVRDYEKLLAVVRETEPDVIFHLAAQPIVRESYRIPRETFEINVMGTVNLLEAVRVTGSTASVVNVTTDKVYLNREERRGYREDEPLDGYDPYSNSKSCSDLVTHSYRNSFFNPLEFVKKATDAGLNDSGSAEGKGKSIEASSMRPIPVISTARAGNVIGGGDFAKDRIVPDCVRAAASGEPVVLRNPGSIRPFQHVLEPLGAYLLLAKMQAENISLEGAYNVGPLPEDAVTTGEVANLFAKYWGEGFRVEAKSDGGPHEAGLLMLDSTKIRTSLGWKSVWNVEEAIAKTVEWSKVYVEGGDVRGITQQQIQEYFTV